MRAYLPRRQGVSPSLRSPRLHTTRTLASVVWLTCAATPPVALSTSTISRMSESFATSTRHTGLAPTGSGLPTSSGS